VLSRDILSGLLGEFTNWDIRDQHPDGALDFIDNVYSPEFDIKALV
jgi:hypothetical protein